MSPKELYIGFTLPQKKENKLIKPLINKLELVQKTNESCGIVT